MEEEKDTSLMELTPYQLRFIDEYMKCGNKREAMMKCGYKGKGKRSTVTSSAAKLYNLPKVQAEIERRRRELAEENLIDVWIANEKMNVHWMPSLPPLTLLNSFGIRAS